MRRALARTLQGAVSALAALCLLAARPGAMVKHGDFKTCAQAAFCARQRAYAGLVDAAATTGATFSLVPASVALDGQNGSISALLMGIEPTDVLTVRFDVLDEGRAVRLRIDERDPIHPRYSAVSDFALADPPAAPSSKKPEAASNSQNSMPFVKVSESKEEVRIRFGKDQKSLLVLYTNPFRFEIAVDNVPAVSFNERNYLYFEHYRKKDDLNAVPRFAKKAGPPPPSDASPADASAQAATDAAAAAVAAADQLQQQHQLTPAEIAINTFKDQLVTGMWEETFNGKSDSKPRGPASIGIDISFPGSSNVYGIPEHASSFSLKTTRGPDAQLSEPYRLYNLDVFEYELDSPMALYGSVPFMMSHKKGLSTGVLFLNAAEMWIDIQKTKGSASSGSHAGSGGSGSSGGSTLEKLSRYVPFMTKRSDATSVETHWMTESGTIDLFFMLGPTQADVLDTYTKLTGRPAMPQQFAVAYHQCRWNYNNEDDVLDVDKKFDTHDIPYDVIWLDIEHTDGKRYFTWDQVKFPTPDKMQQAIAVKQRKMVTIIDPHIKKDSNYHVSKQAQDANLFVKNSNGEVYDGWCWPGDSNWIDYTNPEARKFWASKFMFSDYKGSTPSLYTWNDMNEPSVFTGPEITMSKDCIHHGGWEHRDVHNAYGMLLHRATFEGHLARSSGNDRPFVLSRAFFVGTQRYGAIWTGDNFARWDHMAASVPMILSIGIAGIPFAGADVGGFFGNPEPELLLRWYQMAAFQPFFRAHAHIDTKRREPWLFGEPYTSLIREAIRRRYKLMPYVYTLFAEASRTGSPVMRPLVYEFPDDEATFAMDDQFMLGRALLAKPVTTQDQKTVDVYLPKSANWYVYETFARMPVPSVMGVVGNSGGMITIDTPLEIVPVFLRGGSIVPRRDRVRRSSSLMKADPFTLVVALDRDGSATGSLYVDDGSSFAYRTRGEYIASDFTFTNRKLTAKVTRLDAISPVTASLSPEATASLGARVERIILVGLTSEPKQVTAIQDQDKRVKADFKVTRAPPGPGAGSSAAGTIIVTVKNPAIVIGHDWSVEFA